MELLISLISGAIGGNVLGGLLKNHNLGLLGNSIAGIAGGALGAKLITSTGINAAGSSDITVIINQVAAGGAGGALMLLVAGFIKSALVK